MNVALSDNKLAVDRIWYDASSGKLYIQSGSYVNGIRFADIADADFESSTPVVRFSVHSLREMVICHHADGQETWLPVDMWLPDGFTP